MTEARHSTILEMCLTSIGNNGQQLNNQLRNIYLSSYGLDFFIDDQKRTILHVLAENPQFKHWEILIKGFVYLDRTDSHLKTALHIAVEKKNLRAIHHLILNCASPLVEDEHGNNPIQYACLNNLPVGLIEILQNYAARQYIANNIVSIGKLCIESRSKDCFELIVANVPTKKLNTLDEDGYALVHHISSSKNPEDAEYLKILIKYGADYNIRIFNNKNEKTPIELATIMEIAEILFSRGANYNKKMASDLITNLIQRNSQWQQIGRCFGPSELHKAVSESNMNYLKSYKGKVDIISTQGKTPLLVALETKSDDIVDELLSRGADPNLKEETMEYNAYHFAASIGYIYALKKFISKKPPDFNVYDSKMRTVLTCSVSSGSLDAVNLILGQKPSFGTSVMQSMEYLIKMDESRAVPIAESLFKEGFPINMKLENGNTLLKEAFDRQKIGLVKAILNHIKNLRNEEVDDSELAKKRNDMIESISESEQQIFISAVINEMPVDLIQAFLDAGMTPKIFSRGRPLIHETAEHKNSDVRNILLKDHNDLIDARDSLSNTFLHRAALLNCALSITDGIGFKISPNEVNSDGDSPLHFLMMSHLRNSTNGAESESSNSVNVKNYDDEQLSLKNYYDFFLKEDNLKLKPINYSSFQAQLEIPKEKSQKEIEDEEMNFEKNLQILLDAGADCTLTNHKGQNIFHICALNNNEIAVRVLIKILPEDVVKKLIDAKDNDNKTPLEIASKERNNSIKCAREMSNITQMSIFDSPLTVDSIKRLIKDGYSLDIYNKEGDSLITTAIKMYPENKEESIELVNTIIQENVNISIEDRYQTDGMNLRPLHHAILVGSIEIARILVERGAIFTVSPAFSSFAKNSNQEEIYQLLKKPDERAGSMEEFLKRYKDAWSQFTGIIQTFENNSKLMSNPVIENYIYDLAFMRRVLRNFVDRVYYIITFLTAQSGLGNFLIYFKDAFVPHIGVSVEYEETIDILNNADNGAYIEFLNQGIGFGNKIIKNVLPETFSVFTWFTMLIGAVIKETPADHPDCIPLQVALNKYSFLGSSVTENQRIANSKKTLQSLKFVVTINDQTTTFTLNDILYFNGPFEMKSFKRPSGPFETEEKDDPFSQSPEWGIKTLKRKIGDLDVVSYYPYGSSFESFFNKSKIAIYLFKKTILFGIQKTADKFKLKFSCKPMEVHWDFGKGSVNDPITVYTPFGSMVLKYSGEDLNYAKKEWTKNVDNIYKYKDEEEELSKRKFEYCYVSWVGEETASVQSSHFMIKCKNKTEAKDIIKNILEKANIMVRNKIAEAPKKKETDPTVYQQVPMINIEFQTLERGEGQGSDIISDIKLSTD